MLFYEMDKGVRLTAVSASPLRPAACMKYDAANHSRLHLPSRHSWHSSTQPRSARAGQPVDARLACSERSQFASCWLYAELLRLVCEFQLSSCGTPAARLAIAEFRSVAGLVAGLQLMLTAQHSHTMPYVCPVCPLFAPSYVYWLQCQERSA